MEEESFPRDEAGQELLLQTLKLKLPLYQATLGITPGQVSQVGIDADMFKQVRFEAKLVEEFSDAFYSMKNALFKGDPVTLPTVIPSISIAALNPAALPNIIKRTRKLIGQIKEAPNYTKTIGEDLGIEDIGTDEPPVELKPIVKAVGIAGYKVEIAYTKKGMSGLRLEIQRKGSANWTFLTNVIGNKVTVDITPTTPGSTEQILLRGIFLKGDTPEGEYSDFVQITLVP